MPNITLDSVLYFYQSHGAASKTNPAVVFLHGSGGDSSVWSGQLKALSDRLRVIAPDLPGHGQSQGNPADTPEEYALWLKALIESLHLPSFILVGHSLGGIIAQQFASMFPETLQGLILIGTGMCFEIQNEYLDMLHQDFDTACLISCRQAYTAKMPPDMLRNSLKMLRRNGAETLSRDLTLCANFNSTAWVHTLSTPCLIMCGTDDAITPCSLSQQLSHKISGSTLTCIDTTGHMVMQEQPDLFNNELLLFIEKNCQPHAQSS